MSSTNVAIKLEDIHKNFGKNTALKGVSLEISKGEIFGLLGPNGAGKTTLTRIIGGQIRPNKGRVKVFGLDVTKRGRQVKSKLGMTPQNISLFDYLTVEENLSFLAHLFNVPTLEESTRINELIDFADLNQQRKDRVDTLSGGMKRRLNLIASLIHDPILLILDEPTVGIDPPTRQAIWEMIFQLRDEGKTVLLSTHMMEEAELLADRIGILDKGQLISLGTPQKLKEQTGLDKIVSVVFNSGTVLGNILESLFQDRIYSRLLKSGQKIRLSFSTSDSSLDSGEIEKIQEECNESIDSIQIRDVSLHDVFVILTGRGLRE
ncbi:MAG: ABC transporter ATP-binding protein [Promethearchaeota archaeon]